MLKNVNKHEEMVYVLQKLIQYVPSVATVNRVVNLDTEEIVTIVLNKFNSILCGGDQLIVEQIHGCKITTYEEIMLIPVMKNFTVSIKFHVHYLNLNT